MAAKKKSDVEITVLGNETQGEVSPVTEEVAPKPTPAAKVIGRVPWCPGCFATSLHGPERKLDASGTARTYSAVGEKCHACGHPAQHYAPVLYVGDRYQVSRQDFAGIVTVVEVGDAGSFVGQPGDSPPMACSVEDCACL